MSGKDNFDFSKLLQSDPKLFFLPNSEDRERFLKDEMTKLFATLNEAVGKLELGAEDKIERMLNFLSTLNIPSPPPFPRLSSAKSSSKEIENIINMRKNEIEAVKEMREKEYFDKFMMHLTKLMKVQSSSPTSSTVSSRDSGGCKSKRLRSETEYSE